MNTSVRHTQGFPNLWKEVDWVSAQNSQVQSIQEFIWIISQKVKGAADIMKVKRGEFLTEEQKKSEIEDEKNRKVEEIINLCKLSEDNSLISLWKLIEKTGNINEKYGHGHTLLTLASWKNNTEIVKLLLVHPDTLVNATDDSKYTSLIWVASRGYTEMFKLLLVHPDTLVNEKDSGENTALLWAIWNGHKEIINLLLSDPRLNLWSHEQWKRALDQLRISWLRTLIKRKMREQWLLSGILASTLSIIEKIFSWKKK